MNSLNSSDNVFEIHNPYKKYKKEVTKTEIKPTPILAEQNLPSSETILTNASQHIKLSIRLPKGIVTSLTLKKNILALWLLYTADEDLLDLKNIFDFRYANNTKEIRKFADKANTLISAFVYRSLEEWDKESGKGLSDFVTEKMIKDIVEDYDTYLAVVGII